MTSESEIYEHTPCFDAMREKLFRAVRKMKGLSGPSVQKVLLTYNGLILGDLAAEEREEIEYRIALTGVLMKRNKIVEDADYARLPKSEAARMLAHAIAAVDW